MRITKGQLKRIIREEYSKLKRQGLIRESSSFDKVSRFRPPGRGINPQEMAPSTGYYIDDPVEEEAMGSEKTVIDLAAEPGGIHIDELVEMFGESIFAKIDELENSGLLYMEDDGTVISLRGY